MKPRATLGERIVFWTLVAASLFLLATGYIWPQIDPMTICQKTHSFETCHRALNR